MVVAGVVLYAAMVSLTAPLTPAAALAVFIPCGVALVLALSRRVPPERQTLRGPLSRTALAWGCLVALTAIWDLVAWLQQPAYNVASAAHPTISLLLDPLTGAPVPRFVLWCLWLFAGYRLVRR
jgi:hypothetical protein